MQITLQYWINRALTFMMEKQTESSSYQKQCSVGTAQKRGYGAFLWRKMSKISRPIHCWFNAHFPKNPSPINFNFHPLRRRSHIIMRPQYFPPNKHVPTPFEHELMIPGQVSTSKLSENTYQKFIRHRKIIWIEKPKDTAPPIQRIQTIPKSTQKDMKCLSKL